MLKPSCSLISYMSNLVKTHGGINCAQGIPGFAPPRELLDKLVEVTQRNVHQYSAGNGYPPLRELISSGITGSAGLENSNVLITNGATEAISTIYLYLRQMFKEGMTTLSFDPVYESYSNLPKIYGDRFISQSSLKDGSFDMEVLEKTVENEKVRLVMICTPGNPYGRIWKKDEIDSVHKICRDNGAFLLVDAVYSDLYFNDRTYLPFEKIDENLFIVSAFSKMLSITGWRIGYIVSTSQHIDKIAKIHDYTGLSSPSLLQVAIAEYLNENDLGADYLKELRKKLISSFNAGLEVLENSGFVTPPVDGGYFIWTQIPEKFDSGLDFALDLYEKKKVGVVPGIHFSENGGRMIRISIAKPVDEISQAVEKIHEFVRTF
ncbi:MAG TPA: pyridoxal phosphate-dependent aminotransferase [bacterium]|nr:pyridoxal phosphate-dependent aminotransferase [bacterium]